MIGDLSIRLSDKLETTLHVMVVENKDKFFLLGNDLMGGSGANLTKLSSSETHSFLVL